MKKEYHKDTDSTFVSYEAGRVSDACGYPAPHWSCYVSYTWSEYMQAYWVYSVQTVGFGAVDDKVTRETMMKTAREVDSYLDYLEDLETCYKKVYGE